MELKEKLDLEDAYMILESEYVANYNDYLAQEMAMKKAEKEK